MRCPQYGANPIRKYRKEENAPVDLASSGAPRADVAKVRPCLVCQSNFESSGFGERICRRCKSTSTWRTGNTSASSRG